MRTITEAKSGIGAKIYIENHRVIFVYSKVSFLNRLKIGLAVIFNKHIIVDTKVKFIKKKYKGGK